MVHYPVSAVYFRFFCCNGGGNILVRKTKGVEKEKCVCGNKKHRQTFDVDFVNTVGICLAFAFCNPEYSSQANALAWMEKRRWNAFMRINGFKKPADIDKYIELNSSIHSLEPNHDKAYQFLFIKLHPCIVECDIKGYPGIYSKENDKRNHGVVDIGPDELDLLCKRLGTDYKGYDYPEADAQKQKTG